MFSVLSRSPSWSSRPRVRNFNFINAHFQRFRMLHPAGTDIQGYLTESNEYKTEVELVTEEDEEDGVVEKVTGTGGHIDGGEGWLDVDAEGDEIKTKEEDDGEDSKDETIREDFDDIDVDDEFDVEEMQIDLNELLELEIDGIEMIMQEEPTIPEAFVLPLNLNHSKDEGSDDDWESTSSSEYSDDSLSSATQEPVIINGVEVILTKAGIASVELGLYYDRRLGPYRCQHPSPLRMCWTPAMRYRN